MLLDFMLYFRAAVIKTACTGTKNKHTGQWNRIECPEKKIPHTYNQLIYEKERQEYTMEKTFSLNGAGKTGQLHVKNEIRTFSHSTYNPSS